MPWRARHLDYRPAYGRATHPQVGDDPLVTEAKRPLAEDEYGMLLWFAEQWPEELGPVVEAIAPDAEAEVCLYEPDGHTTVTIGFNAAPSKLPSTSPYEGEALWNVDGMPGSALLFSGANGVMLEVMWLDGWPGRFPRPDELRSA
jgi:hypothetical protein